MTFIIVAGFFLRKYAREINKNVKEFEPAAAQLLMDYDWPGNIRELENTLERAVIMTEGDNITRSDLNLTTGKNDRGELDFTGDFPPGGICLEAVEKTLILKALERRGWVQTDAAALLHLSPRALNYKIKKHNITHESWKANN